jgi:hypothetical protein
MIDKASTGWKIMRFTLFKMCMETMFTLEDSYLLAAVQRLDINS